MLLHTELTDKHLANQEARSAGQISLSILREADLAILYASLVRYSDVQVSPRSPDQFARVDEAALPRQV